MRVIRKFQVHLVNQNESLDTSGTNESESSLCLESTLFFSFASDVA